MKENSINSNGCSVCGQGKENYTTFRPAHRPKQTFYQYDYRINEELFSTVAPTLEECRRRRDEWVMKKAIQVITKQTETNMDAVKDYFEQQRAEEQIEKELNVDRWVIISIGYRGRDYRTPDVLLYKYNIPVYLKEKYNWVIRWRTAKIQCQYPKEYICTWYTNYDKRTSLRLEHDSLYTKIISAKAWLTRAKNKKKNAIRHCSMILKTIRFGWMPCRKSEPKKTN